MSANRWNYNEQRYEVYERPTPDESPCWVVDKERQDIRRASCSDEALIKDLLSNENYTWTAICKKYAYSVGYLKRKVHTIILGDIRRAGEDGPDYIEYEMRVNRKDELTDKEQKEYEVLKAKWEPVVKQFKERLFDRADESLKERKLRMKQVTRTSSLFTALGIPVPK